MKKISTWWNEKGRNSVMSTLAKAENWWVEKGRDSVKAALKKVGNTCWRGLKALAKVKISWGAIIACILLAFMGDQGLLDNWPMIDWLVECELRLLDWMLGLLRDLLQWCVGQYDYMPDAFVEWVKYIIGMQ